MAPNTLSTRSDPQAHVTGARTGKPRGWWLLLFLCLGVSVYALGYVVLGERIYPAEFAESFRARPWGIYPHAFFGMIALALGPFQFLGAGRLHRPRFHRMTGRVYLSSAMLTGLAGLYMSIYSFGGWVTHLGFGLLAAGLLLSSTMAWSRVRRGDFAGHRAWVIRGFALLFSAVTLRAWLPMLVIGLGAFDPAFRIVSWLCWVPNLLIAEAYLRFSVERDSLKGAPLPVA